LAARHVAQRLVSEAPNPIGLDALRGRRLRSSDAWRSYQLDESDSALSILGREPLGRAD
jgi:hypothetical protein